MDVDGFRSFLQRSPAALKNQSLKYHLIDNLLTRSLKVKIAETWKVLAQFIDLIDVSSVAKSVGNYERIVFLKFDEDVKNRKDSKGNRVQFPHILVTSVINFIRNESKRLNPLKEYINTSDFNGAMAVIESSNHEINVTFKDFLYLLDQKCSSGRYHFLIWAITFGHFNAHEKYGNQLLTPLMFAAKAPKWSNDIVKALLVKAPATTAETDATGRKALHYAMNNNLLPERLRRPLVKMLELESPTYPVLNEILNKYAPGTGN